MAVSTKAREAFRQGTNRLANGDRQGALAHLDQAIDDCPEYAEAYNQRGATRHALGNPEGAVADFARAAELSPTYIQAWQNCGAVRATLGQFAHAIADFDRAIALIQAQAEAGSSSGRIGQVPRKYAALAFHGRGAARHSLFDYAGAVADFNQAIAIDPELCVAYISRGHARYHLRDMQACDDFWRAYQLDPVFAMSESFRTRSDDLRRDGEAKILENCRKHIRIHPGDVMAYVRRSVTFLLLNRDAEAELDIQRAIRIKPDQEAHFRRGIEVIKNLRAR